MYVPEKTVTNDELSKFIDTSDEWISKRVGVRSRHVCVDEDTADLAYKAADKALKNSGISASELDLIIAASVSADYITPPLACIVQEKIGAKCTAFDINAACPAFIFLLDTAAGYFARGTVKRVLVVGAEAMTRIADWSDRSSCVLFGDGAGAAVLETGESYIDSILRTTGNIDILYVSRQLGTTPFSDLTNKGNGFVNMKGQEVFKFAVSSMCGDINELLSRNNLTLDDIKYIVPHQANKRIIDFAAEKLGADIDKFYVNIDRYGNTSAASIPIALSELDERGSLQHGDLIIMTAFGGGLASAACLIKW